MNRRNYARELERIIIKADGRKPRILLHSCCGPCSSAVLEYLTGCFEVTILWFNPNIFPEEEFNRRFSTQMEIIQKMGLNDKVKIISRPWQHELYLEAVKGLEKEKEGGKRCEACFRVRLSECAKAAAEGGFDYFCSTLTVSRHKNAVIINAVGEDCAKTAGSVWLPSDFKKHDGENRSVELSEKYGIYRQVYCGCEFSLENRLAGKTVREEANEGGE